MDDSEYIQLAAEMLCYYQIQRILAYDDKEIFKNLSELPQSKRFHKVYRIFSNCSEAKSSQRILQIIKKQLGICEIKDFDFLKDLSDQGLFYWFCLRHQENKKLDCGVYSIFSLLTEHTYIGSSVSIEKRFANHRYHLNSGTHRNSKLQELWHEYGEYSFVFIVRSITTDYKRHEKLLIENLKNFVPLLNCTEKIHE